MLNHNQRIQLIKNAFDDLSGENRSAIRAVRGLCSVAATVDQLECYADAAARIHVFVDGKECFECVLDGGRGNFRNFLAVMFSFAKQFAEDSVAPELSPYKINCIINMTEFGEAGSLVRLQTINTASEQSFAFFRI